MNHTRVNARSDGRGYYIAVKTKAGNVQLEEPAPFFNLIEKAKKKLKLKEVAPGSKFVAIFKDAGGGGYLPPADDSDSD